MAISLLTTATRQQMILDTALSVAVQRKQPQWLVHIDSDDDWSQTINQLQTIVPQVTLTQGKMGRVEALIKLHHNVKTDYVGWLDDDDWLAPDWSENVHQTPLLHTNHYRVTRDKVIIGKQPPHHYFQYSMSLYHAVGGLNRDYPTATDYELFLRMSRLTKPYFISKPLYYYRIHDDRISVRERASQYKNARKAESDHQCRVI